MSNIKTKYHYFYKITNLINNHFYYGVHNTNNLNDGYMGSGKRLHIAYKKYGIENFNKEILKFFNTAREAFEYEAEIVNENLINDNNCYNITKGGIYPDVLGLVVVKDNDNNKLLVSKDDPRYLSGELIFWQKGIHKDWMINTFIAKDKNGNFFKVSKDDPRYLSGELTGCLKGLISVIDKNGNTLKVSKDDPRYLSGELKFNWVGRHHSDITKKKMHEKHLLNNHQQGEKNSQFGTCWIHNEIKNKKIKKEELENYIKNGWVSGRKMKLK